MITIPNRQVVFYMELEQFCTGALTLQEINAPIYKDVKIEELDDHMEDDLDYDLDD